MLSGPEELGWDSAAAKPQPSRLPEGTPGMLMCFYATLLLLKKAISNANGVRYDIEEHSGSIYTISKENQRRCDIERY